MSPSSATCRPAPATSPASGAPPRSTRDWRCSSRRRGRDRSGTWCTSMRNGEPVTAGQRRHHRRRTATPHHRAAAAAASALGTCWTPCRASATSPLPQGVTRRKPGSQLGVEHHVLGPHLGRRRRRRSPAPGTGCAVAMRATRGSSKLRTATPDAGSAATSSHLARATPSRSPKYSTWAMADAGDDPDDRAGHLGQTRDVARRHGHPSRARPTCIVGRVEKGEWQRPARC